MSLKYTLTIQKLFVMPSGRANLLTFFFFPREFICTRLLGNNDTSISSVWFYFFIVCYKYSRSRVLPI